jgi:hypothetical protein
MKTAWTWALLATIGLGCTSEIEGVGAALRAREGAASADASATGASAGTVATGTTEGSATGTRVVGVFDGVIVDRFERPPTLPNNVPWNRCDRSRLVGRVIGASQECPAATGGWVLRSDRFANAAGSKTGPRFCGYDFVGASWTVNGLPALRHPGSDDVWTETPPLGWLEPDCEAVVPLAHPIEDEALATYAAAHVEATRRHVDRVASLPRVPSLLWLQPSLPQTVDVWILDSSPTDTTGIEPSRGAGSEHGYAVGLAIRDTVCPQGRGGVCPVRFRHRQVLDLDGQSRGVGYIGDLADGVMKAVDGGARVIVLAVGFHEDYALFGDDETPGLHTAATALSVALNYAANRGAIVVSAAGNAQFGPDVASYYGPNGLYPGEMTRWQAYSMDVGGPSFDFAMTYSASALDGFDEAAPNARLEGEASLAAPGFAQVFEDPFRGGYVLGGTGSSFAAAHLAAVVTLVRAYRPSASIREVLQTVANTSISLGRPAHLGAYGLSGGGDVRRISACRALASAVRTACGARRVCPVPTCNTLPAFAGAAASELDVEALLALTSEEAEPTYVAVTDYVCDGEEHRVDGDGVPASFCPAQSFGNGMAAPETVGSQPGVDPCGSCSVVVAPDASWLYVALDPAVASSLTSPVLRLGTKSYALPSTLVASALYKIVRVKLPATTNPPTSASLSFLSSASSTQSVTSHVPVYLQN